MPNIEESSDFRAFLGAILSVVKNVSVESSAYNLNIELDTIMDEQNDRPLSKHKHDIDGSSGDYHSPGTGASTPMTRNHDRDSLLIHTFLGRYQSLGSPAFRLLRLLPTRLKTSKH